MVKQTDKLTNKLINRQIKNNSLISKNFRHFAQKIEKYKMRILQSLMIACVAANKERDLADIGFKCFNLGDEKFLRSSQTNSCPQGPFLRTEKG